MPADRPLALVLGGGGALGAYEGGVYEELHAQGLLPDRVAGTSIGAVNAALIAGNPPARRVDRLRQFWEQVSDPVTEGGSGDTDAGRAGKAAAAVHARLVGRPGLYRPIMPRLFLSDSPWGSPSIYQHEEAGATLADLIDFERMLPMAANLTDLMTGEPVVVSSERERLRPEHLLASMALIPDFPPVEIDGRLYADGGLSANVPIDAVLAPPPDGDMLVIAVDLLGEPGRPAFSVDGMLERSNDLMFLNQTRAMLALADARQRLHGRGSVTVALLAYDGTGERIAQKTWDFGRRSIEVRWAAGRAAASGVRERIMALPPTPPGRVVVHRVGQAAAGEALR
jgi:NTE family protein